MACIHHPSTHHLFTICLAGVLWVFSLGLWDEEQLIGTDLIVCRHITGQEVRSVVDSEESEMSVAAVTFSSLTFSHLWPSLTYGNF